MYNEICDMYNIISVLYNTWLHTKYYLCEIKFNKNNMKRQSINSIFTKKYSYKYFGLDIIVMDVFNISIFKANSPKKQAKINVMQSNICNLASSKGALKLLLPHSFFDSMTSKVVPLVSKKESLASRKESLVSKEEFLASKEEPLALRKESLLSREVTLVSKEVSLVSKEKSLASREESLISWDMPLIPKNAKMTSLLCQYNRKYPNYINIYLESETLNPKRRTNLRRYI